jgi:hypothetical protein
MKSGVVYFVEYTNLGFRSVMPYTVCIWFLKYYKYSRTSP